jgi:ABC-type transporter Mla maintaining outer membrane lipid asymmetry ATPase subunit MlaF
VGALDTPTTGDVFFEGKNIRKFNDHAVIIIIARVLVLFSVSPPAFEFTAIENVCVRVGFSEHIVEMCRTG